MFVQKCFINVFKIEKYINIITKKFRNFKKSNFKRIFSKINAIKTLRSNKTKNRSPTKTHINEIIKYYKPN